MTQQQIALPNPGDGRTDDAAPEKCSVLIIAQHYPPETLGGVETRFQAMADSAWELGHDVNVIVTNGTRPGSRAARPTGPYVRQLGWNIDPTLHVGRPQRALVEVLATVPSPSVVWIANPGFANSVKTVWPHVPIVLMPGQVRSLSWNKCLTRLVSNFRRAGGRFAIRWASRDLAFRKAVRLCDVLAVPCAQQQSVMNFDAKWIARKTRVLSRGVRVERWRECRRVRQACPETPIKLLVACRLDPIKNIEMAVRAVARVVHQGTPAELRIVGSGTADSALRQFVSSCGLDHCVRFAAMTEDMQSHYRWADAFVMCSNNELFGNTVLESLAAGCPVLLRANDPPHVVIGCWEQLHDCPAVIKFATNDDAGLAEAIRGLHEEPGHLTALATLAEQASDHLDWRNFIGQYMCTESHMARSRQQSFTSS